MFGEWYQQAELGAYEREGLERVGGPIDNWWNIWKTIEY